MRAMPRNIVDRFVDRPHMVGEAYLVAYVLTFGSFALLNRSTLRTDWVAGLIVSALAAPFVGMAALAAVATLLYLVDFAWNGPKRRKGICPKCRHRLTYSAELPSPEYPSGRQGKICPNCGYQSVYGMPRWADWAGF